MIRKSLALLAVIACATGLLPQWKSGTAASAAPLVMGRVHETFQPVGGKVFILVIGNDARHGNPDSARADAIHIFGINTKTMRGGILNFPRDSWVSIPGRGSAKINEATTAGGPLVLARTLENLTGIRIDYWAMVGFEGFVGIMHDLGGVRMDIRTDIYDPYGSGAHIDAGKQRLSAPEALAFARTRHSFGSGDIARTTNQGRLLLALLRKFRTQVAWNPGMLMKWMATTSRHARLNVPADEMFRLGILASQLSRRRVSNVTVPVSIGSVGAASVVFISPAARSIYQRFARNGSL